MHRRALLLSAASLALAGCADGPAANMSPAANGAPAGDGEDRFGVALYRAVAAEGGDQFISPFSAAGVFALLYPGARGDTAAELARVFGFAPSAAAAVAQIRAQNDAVTAPAGDTAISIANAAWVEKTMALQAAYAQAIRDELDATIESVDFQNDPAGALEAINAWAARETHDRIPQILNAPPQSASLVLTNAVYFKGRWDDPFSADATEEGDFHAESGATARAELMHKFGRFRYIEEDDVQAADFDYDDGAFALAVFLPKSPTGLRAFESGLTAESLETWLARLTAADETRLDVTLPKVELDQTYELNPLLQALGLRAAFTGAADFSGIAGPDHALMVSRAIQKTFLAIDEEGTEAAAVSAVVMVTGAILRQPEPPPIAFKADHPFFVVLRHKPTGARLFYGRIAEL